MGQIFLGKITVDKSGHNFDIVSKVKNWRPPSLSELTPMIFNMGLTYLDSEALIYLIIIFIFLSELM